jgi:hypothetical protein
MKNNPRSLFLLATILSLTAIVSAQQNLGGGRLTGTWDAEVRIYNCETGIEIISFQSTANFNKGGTFTGITTAMPPATRTPEVGIWRHETGNSYKFRFKAYQFNPAGAPVLYQIVTHTLELANDNQTYVSEGGVKFFNMDGVQTGTGCSSGVGTRMTLD